MAVINASLFVAAAMSALCVSLLFFPFGLRAVCRFLLGLSASSCAASCSASSCFLLIPLRLVLLFVRLVLLLVVF